MQGAIDRGAAGNALPGGANIAGASSRGACRPCAVSGAQESILDVLPGLGENINIGGGTSTWQNPGGITAEPDGAAVIRSGTWHVADELARFSLAGTLVGDDKAQAGNWPASGQNSVIYGGAADLWGRAWTAQEVKDIQFNLRVFFSTDLIQIAGTHLLRASAFDFSALPDGAAIRGLQVELRRERLVAGSTFAAVYWVKLSVLYGGQRAVLAATRAGVRLRGRRV